MFIIIGLLLKEYLYKMFYKIEYFFLIPTIAKSLTAHYSEKKIRLNISDPIKQFSNTSNKCIVSNEKSMKSKFDNFKKKCHETFRDTYKFDNDIPNYREEFGELMTEIMISDHDISNTNILGFSEFHTNVFLFKMYLNEMFKPQGNRSDSEMSTNRLMKKAQIIKFLKYYQTRFAEDVIFNDKNIDFSSLEDDKLWNYFKQMILFDSTFGLAIFMNQFVGLLFRYIHLRKRLLEFSLSDDDKDDLEDQKDDLKDEVKKTYDDNTKIFKNWDKNKNDEYINYLRFLQKLQYTDDNGNKTVVLNNLINTIFQDLDKKIIKKPTFTFNCLKPLGSAEKTNDEGVVVDVDIDYRSSYMDSI